jgi:hypothetical protein
MPRTRPGIDPGTFRLVAQRLNHYATPGPNDAYRKRFYKNTYTLMERYFAERGPMWQGTRNLHLALFKNQRQLQEHGVP